MEWFLGRYVIRWFFPLRFHLHSEKGSLEMGRLTANVKLFSPRFVLKKKLKNIN